jgi:hypothetical protein
MGFLTGRAGDEQIDVRTLFEVAGAVHALLRSVDGMVAMRHRAVRRCAW